MSDDILKLALTPRRQSEAMQAVGWSEEPRRYGPGMLVAGIISGGLLGWLLIAIATH